MSLLIQIKSSIPNVSTQSWVALLWEIYLLENINWQLQGGGVEEKSNPKLCASIRQQSKRNGKKVHDDTILKLGIFKELTVRRIIMSCVFEQLLVKEAEGSETSEPEPEQNRPPDKAKERSRQQRLASRTQAPSTKSVRLETRPSPAAVALVGVRSQPVATTTSTFPSSQPEPYLPLLYYIWLTSCTTQ